MARAMPAGSPPSYGTKDSGSNSRSACSKLVGTHHRKCPLSASASASSAWWFPISRSFTTTRHGFPKPRHSKMEPAPACVMTRSEARISASRLGLKANVETSSPGLDTRFRTRPDASPRPNCTATEVNPRARRVATTFGRSSAASNASKDVVPTVTKRRLPLAAAEVDVLLDATASVPARPRPRGGMRARRTRGRLGSSARGAVVSYSYLFDDFSSTEKTFFARESNDAAPHTGDAATMPTFDMLCAESIADAVLGRDGDVARRLRAETGASVELLAPQPHTTTSLFAFEPADALVARRVPRNRDVAVRVSCDDALSTAFSCPAQTCLFRLHARLAAVARHYDERGDASRLRSEKAPPASNYGLDRQACAGTLREPTTTHTTQSIFFRVLAPRGACDYRSVRERTGASVRVAPYASRADTDLVVIDRHESRGECHVEAMRRVVASLGAFQFQRTTRTSAAASLGFPFPVRDATTRDRHEATHGDTRRRPPFTDSSSFTMTNDAPSRCCVQSDSRGYGGYERGARSSFPAGSRYARLSEKNETRQRNAPVSNDTPKPREPEPPTVRMHLPVPTSLVRAVVGRGGANIQRVRAESGAKVKLHDCAPGAATRILELGGARRDVQAARALVVQCLERIFQENPDQDEFY